MRADRLSPRTWMLAGAAGWAIVLSVLAFAGMGGRLGEAEADATGQKLPDTKLPPSSRPGVMEQYAEVRNRPLFSENRRHVPFVIDPSGEDAQANTFDYTLTSVLISGDVQLVILKPAAEGAKPVRVKLGEAVETAPQWSLATIEARAAVFRGPEGDRRLDLRVFNGVGGTNPPPVGGPSPPQQGVINETLPGQPGNEVPPQPVVEAPPPPPPAQGGNVSTEVQLEAIRKRIEERRAQLRQQAAQEAQSTAPPGQTP